MLVDLPQNGRMKRLRRLRSLDVHEVSLVKDGAVGKNFLIRKNKDGSPMPTAQSIRDQLLSVPEPIVKNIEAVAKAAGDTDGINEEAQAAMKAAGRILAPHADSLTSDQVTKLMQAIGMLAQDKEDTDAIAADTAQNQQAAAIENQEAATNKAADGDEEDDADEEAADKAAPKWLKAKMDAKKKGDEKDSKDPDDDEDEDSVDKTGCASGPGIGDMDLKKQTKLNKSAEDGVSAPSQMRYASSAPEDRAPLPLETAVAKSAELDLKGFTEAQRAALEPILKSQKAQAEATEQLRQAHKEAVEKSAALQHKLDRKEFVAKAAAFPHLGTAEALGEKLHNLHVKDPDGYEAWVGILKSANASADASPLFKEHGSALGATGDVAEKMKAAVTGLVQKSATPMSYAQAESEFLKTSEGKRLYAEEREEARRAARSN